jgi:glutamate 5-kinase
VLKIGASLLCAESGAADYGFIRTVVGTAADLVAGSKEVVIVSSGAIAMGMSALGLSSRPKDLAHLQAAAAVGQHELMELYRRSFRERSINCGQVLLTWDDLDDRKRYLNAKNTLLTLLKLKSVPVINENDTVSTQEIKFGDNDRLSALVASLINADILIILSDVPGLFGREKKVIPAVAEINAEIKALASPVNKRTSVGGMVTKIEAAKIAVDSGIPCVIAHGKRPNIVADILKGPFARGGWTVFLPKGSLAARERWIAFGAKPKGKIFVDDGARAAILDGKSLLCVGVAGCEGNFAKGDIVSLKDSQQREVARGKSGISAKELDKVKGKRYAKEIAHRDDIVIL